MGVLERVKVAIGAGSVLLGIVSLVVGVAIAIHGIKAIYGPLPKWYTGTLKDNLKLVGGGIVLFLTGIYLAINGFLIIVPKGMR